MGKVYLVLQWVARLTYLKVGLVSAGFVGVCGNVLKPCMGSQIPVF